MLFHLSILGAGKEKGLWFAPVGIGLALTAWKGLGVVALLFADLVLARLSEGNQGIARPLVESILLAGQIGLSWWCYASLAQGARRLDDPHSAVMFLILVPGILAAAFALCQSLAWQIFEGAGDFLPVAGDLWRARALGILVLVPPLLVTLTPVWVEWGWIPSESKRQVPAPTTPMDWSWGERIEVVGLAVTAGIVGLVLAVLQARSEITSWPLWGVSLLVIVWASIRQGSRGGPWAASAAALLALPVAASLNNNLDQLNPLQGNLLAQCSVALLVGCSVGWIRASENRYRQVIGHIPVVLYSVRVPRWVPARFTAQYVPGNKGEKSPGTLIMEFAEITLVSPASRTILGRAPLDLLGPFFLWLECIEPADREVVIASLTQLCLKKQPVTCEYRLASQSSEPPASSASADILAGLALPPRSPGILTRWVRDTLVPHYSPDGHLDGWEGVVEDISESRVLAHDLRRTTAMLHALVSHLPMGVFFVQAPLGQPLLVNARAKNLLGQREDWGAGLRHLSLVYRLHRPDGSEYPWEELPVSKALQFGSTVMADDIVVHRADGRRIHLMSWAAPVDLGGQGKPDAAVWVFEDLNLLKQAEAARRDIETRLQGTKEIYQNLVDSLPLMLLQFDREGMITFQNAATQQFLGYAPDELAVADFWLDRICLDDREQFQTALGRTFKGYVARLESRWLARDGSEKVGYALLQPQLQGEVVIGCTCLVVDMTLQRRLEQELRQAQRLELVGRLAGGTVHDFNNMLTVMMGLTALAKSGLPAGHPAHQELQGVLDAGDQAIHLAGQLLTFSKHRNVPARNIDLNSVVANTLKMLRGVLTRNIQVEAKLSAKALTVQADENQLKQALMNLCLNARDAMPGGGKLTVRTEEVPPDQANAITGIEFRIPHRHLWTRLIVEDSGQGMKAEVQARIFEPFFTTKEHGTGLGLAVVRQIVDNHGGRLEVNSSTNEGTRIEIWLPAANHQN